MDEIRAGRYRHFKDNEYAAAFSADDGRIGSQRSCSGYALEQSGYLMRGGTIVDATIINTPSSTKNVKRVRDSEMHQTKKGNEWRFGMKCHAGVDTGSGPIQITYNKFRKFNFG